MGRSNHRDRTGQVIRLAAQVAKVAAIVARVIQELVKIPW